ncbi:MAG: hypothetical protein OEY97_10845 [Nitrospirota bacterium]|nr:hypothetical protein [Nitrospirota bacterium]
MGLFSHRIRGRVCTVLAALLLCACATSGGTGGEPAAPVPPQASPRIDLTPPPTLRVAVAPVPGHRTQGADLVRKVMAQTAAIPGLSGRIRITLLQVDGPAGPSGLPPAELVQAAGDADFLIWGHMGENGHMAASILHRYALDPEWQAWQAAGSRPVVPVVHRLPDFVSGTPAPFVDAVLGVALLYSGQPLAAGTLLERANEQPDLTLAERFPLVFFLSLADLTIGTARRDGDRVDRAVAGFGGLRTLVTRANHPELAGPVRFNRGMALAQHPFRNGPATREEAIRSLEEALPFYPARQVPFLRARILHQIATVEQQQPDDRDGYHLHRAIRAYRRALRLWDPERFPLPYRHALHNMGVCLQRLPVGDPNRNLIAAISVYRQAVAVPGLAGREELHAPTWNNMGRAFQSLPLAPGDRNLHDAVTAYTQALSWWTPERDPVQYVAVNRQIALAYRQMREGDRRAHALMAMVHLDKAVRQVSPTDDPVRYGMIQAERGTILADLPGPLDPRALLVARAAYREALTVLTPDNLPILYSRLVDNLREVERRLEAIQSQRNLPAAQTP